MNCLPARGRGTVLVPESTRRSIILSIEPVVVRGSETIARVVPIVNIKMGRKPEGVSGFHTSLISLSTNAGERLTPENSTPNNAGYTNLPIDNFSTIYQRFRCDDSREPSPNHQKTI
jgi:hypothetical protein